jgi:8-oxo-dGTP pyrophosphatase MutT (NUDIX family)
MNDYNRKRMDIHPHTSRQMFCNNCGGKGHLFRTCRDPILSCGIMLINSDKLPTDPEKVRVLMIRRKDSMSFAEFMRGKYDPKDIEYISKLLRNTTLREQGILSTETFDTVWSHLWGEDRSSADYKISKEKFESLDIKTLIRENVSPYVEPEWGFPKGRRVRGESDIDCAIREFTEETNISRDAYILLKNIVLEETFMGLNGIQYRHVYFIALLKNPALVNLHQRFTPMQRREISGIAWKSLFECEALIRPHHVERQGMVNQLKSILETFETEL